MNRLYVFFLVFMTGTPFFAQSFQPGYLITSGGNRQNIELDDRDWVDNPSRFRYRLADGSVQYGSTSDVVEFGLSDGSLRYRRMTVAIDSSGDHLSDLVSFPEPLFGERTVFLLQLVEGEADLFYWEEGERKRFFFRLGEDDAVQLIDRRYLRDDRVVIQHRYLGQLQSALSCSTTDGMIYDLRYTRESLAGFFEAYNSCLGVDFTVYERPSPERSVFWYGRVGGSRYSGELLDYIHGGREPYERHLLPTYAQSFGLEVEYSVPRAGGRWSMLAGVDFQRIRSLSLSAKAGEAALEWQGICIPLGVRRFVPLSPHSAITLGGRAIAQITLDGSVHFMRTFITTSQLYTHWAYQIAGFVGFRHRRLLAEIRYGRQLNILSPYRYYASRFSELHLSVAYRIR